MKNTSKFIIAASLAFSYTNAYGDSSSSQENTAAEPMAKTHGISDVFLSSPNYCFAAQFTALFLQPTTSNLHYAAEATPLPAPSPNWNIFEIDPDYHFGFDVGICGVFHQTNTTLMLNWEHFHSSDSSSKTVSTTDMVGPFFTIGPNASPYNKTKGHVHFHFDEANLDYGVLVNFGDRAKTNFYAGISYAYIQETLKSSYINEDQEISRTIKTPARFSGAGPQVGVNFSYRIIEGFHLTGNAAASLLVGSMKNHTTYESRSPLQALVSPTPNVQKTKVVRRSQVVPGCEGRLGLAYTYEFRKHYMISLEAGYEAQIYFNAIQFTDMGSEVPLNSVQAASVGVYARTFQRNPSNFALSGPYATLALGF